MNTPTKQKSPRSYEKHGDIARNRRIKARGLASIDGRTAEGREALAFREDAVKRKGGANCPYHIRVEIRLATFDLFRLLHLQSYLINDVNQRGTPVNRRRRELPKIHDQYTVIEDRFARRLERLELNKPIERDPVKELYGEAAA